MVMHKCIIGKKVDKMNENMKELIRHLIFKTVGELHFIRLIEWRKMLKWLNPKEREKSLISHVEEER